MLNGEHSINGSHNGNGHGGKREGAGRKPKIEEAKIAEKLSPLDDIAFDALQKGVEKGDYQFVKMFMEYRYGKPRETVQMNSVNENIEIIRVVDIDGTEI